MLRNRSGGTISASGAVIFNKTLRSPNVVVAVKRRVIVMLAREEFSINALSLLHTPLDQ